MLGTTEVRVAADGELEFRGGQVFTGYWNNPEATAQVLADDGWFSSGDLGEVDADGYIRITGRKKEILVTAGLKIAYAHINTSANASSSAMANHSSPHSSRSIEKHMTVTSTPTTCARRSKRP